MKDFEFIRNVSIGQYVEKESLFHQLHPGCKLFALIILTGCVLAAPGPAALGLAWLVLTAVILISRISLRFVYRGILPALPYLVLIAVLQLLFSTADPGDRILWKTPWDGWFALRITPRQLVSILVFMLRFFVLMGTFTWFSSVNTANELARGTELFFSPLRGLRFPAHEASLLVTVTFRFIPILAQEAETLMKAQAARGADIGTHKGGPVQRIVSFFPLFLPLFHNALLRAETLIEAMETKCYSGGYGRTSLIVYRLKPKDILVLLVLTAACALILYSGYSGIPGIPVWIQGY